MGQGWRSFGVTDMGGTRERDGRCGWQGWAQAVRWYDSSQPRMTRIDTKGNRTVAAGLVNKFAPARAGCFVGGLNEILVAVFCPDIERKPGRRRDRFAQAPRARGTGAQADRRPLYLSAARA